MILDLLTYLRSFGSIPDALDAIKSTYSIHVNSHTLYPNLMQFKYDQLESTGNQNLINECRGIILDSENNWSVVAYPFKRFFNQGESRAARIEWATARLWEKVDGSLMFLYWYDGQWNVASSGLPDASGSINGSSHTFASLFWETWNTMGYELPTDTKITYIFEMTSPETMVIVPHSEAQITFIGARNIITGEEYSVDDDRFSAAWVRPRRFNVDSEARALDMCMKMNPMEQEGFVIVDAKFNRIKMKSPQYAAIAHLGFTKEEIIEKGLRLDKYDESLQMKWMLKIILINECDEFLAYYPQYTAMYRDIRAKYDLLVMEMHAMYNLVKDITNQFEYASKVKDHPLSGIFFRLKAGSLASIEAGIRETDVKKLLTIIKKIK